MTTAILSAVPEEQSGLLLALEQGQRCVRAGRVYWTGQLHGRSVVLALSGMGKVAAATTATALIEHFRVARIVFTGVAGGLGDGVQVGDIVVAQAYLQHDMNAAPLFPRWELPGYARALLPCHPALTAVLVEAAHRCARETQATTADTPAQVQVHHGLVISGDRFVATANESDALRAGLRAAGHDALAVEMEGAAVAQVCHDYGTPFAAVRSISDRADDAAHGDFAAFVQTVASRYAEHMVQTLLRAL